MCIICMVYIRTILDIGYTVYVYTIYTVVVNNVVLYIQYVCVGTLDVLLFLFQTVLLYGLRVGLNNAKLDLQNTTRRSIRMRWIDSQ